MVICPDCRHAADFASDEQGDLALAAGVITPDEADHIRRGHARCRTRQLTAGQGRLRDGAPVTILGHHCDCQHRLAVAGDATVVPARQEPRQSDEDAVVEGLEVRDA